MTLGIFCDFTPARRSMFSDTFCSCVLCTCCATALSYTTCCLCTTYLTAVAPRAFSNARRTTDTGPEISSVNHSHAVFRLLPTMRCPLRCPRHRSVAMKVQQVRRCPLCFAASLCRRDAAPLCFRTADALPRRQPLPRVRRRMETVILPVALAYLDPKSIAAVKAVSRTMRAAVTRRRPDEAQRVADAKTYRWKKVSGCWCCCCCCCCCCCVYTQICVHVCLVVLGCVCCPPPSVRAPHDPRFTAVQLCAQLERKALLFCQFVWQLLVVAAIIGAPIAIANLTANIVSEVARLRPLSRPMTGDFPGHMPHNDTYFDLFPGHWPVPLDAPHPNSTADPLWACVSQFWVRPYHHAISTKKPYGEQREHLVHASQCLTSTCSPLPTPPPRALQPDFQCGSQLA